jgi:hypothetical protein
MAGRTMAGPDALLGVTISHYRTSIVAVCRQARTYDSFGANFRVARNPVITGRDLSKGMSIEWIPVSYAARIDDALHSAVRGFPVAKRRNRCRAENVFWSQAMRRSCLVC